MKKTVFLILLKLLVTINNSSDNQEKNLENIVVSEENPSTSANNNHVTQNAHLETNKNWLDMRAINAKDMLEFIPGIFIQQRNGAESARISIRGSGLGRMFQGGGLTLLYNDIPINTADGSFDFQTIDPWMVDYVTTYRGYRGMIMGANTLGGAINLTSLPPDGSKILGLSMGSYNTKQLFAGLSENKEFSRYGFKTSYFSQDGFRQHNQQNTIRFDADYHTRSESGNHRVSLFHMDSYAELPSSLSKTMINENARQSRNINIMGNFHRDLQLTRLSYRYGHHNNSTLSLYYFDKQLINPVFTYINRNSKDTGINVRWNTPIENFFMGFNIQMGWQQERRRENNKGLPGNERVLRKQKAVNAATYASYNWPIDKTLDFSTLIQFAHAKRTIHEIFPNTIRNNNIYNQFNSQIGLSYKNEKNIGLSAYYAHSFEPPSFAELNNGNQPGINSPIRAQIADTFEINTHLQNETSVFNATLYYSRLKNEFVRFRFPDGKTKTINAHQSRRLGLELTLSASIKSSGFVTDDEFLIQTNYLWTRAQLHQDIIYDDNRIPGIPSHYIRSKFIYKHPSGLSITPHVEWVPSAYFIDLANTFKTDSYVTYGVAVNWQKSATLWWSFEARNLSDQRYISTSLPIPDAQGIDGNYFYSGEGRSFFASLKYNF